MLRILAAVSAVVLFTFAMGCSQIQQQSGSHDADVKAITDDVLRWKSDLNTRDIDKALSHYAADTIVVVPGMPVARDAESRRTTLKEMIADPALNLASHECPQVEVSKSGDYGYAQCNDVMTATDPATGKPVTAKSGLVEVYRKQADGSWKTIADIAYPDAPPVPSAKAGK